MSGVTSALITNYFPKRKKTFSQENADLKAIKNTPTFKRFKNLVTSPKNQQVVIKAKTKTLSSINTTIQDYFSIENKKQQIKSKDDKPSTNVLDSKFLLPPHYYKLFDMFKVSDHIVSIYYNKKETCFFTKLKEGVEQLRKKKFLERHICQIITVYPEAYELSYQKLGLRSNLMGNANHDDLKLVISPIMHDNVNLPKERFNPQIVIKRRAIFYHNLLNIVKQLHKKFLIIKSIDMSEEDIKRWHPQFDLNNLPEIQPTKLPDFPENNDDNKIYTANDAFHKITLCMSPKTQRALSMVSKLNSMSPTSPFSLRHSSTPKSQVSLDNTPRHNSTNTKISNLILDTTPKTCFNSYNKKNGMQTPESRSQSTIKKSFNFYQNELGGSSGNFKSHVGASDHNLDIEGSPHLKGLSSDLINRIRCKESQKAQMIITRDDVEENYLKTLQKLPDFLRMLKGFYLAENKNTLAQAMVEKKVRESQNAKSSGGLIENDCSIDTYFEILRKLDGQCIQVVKVREVTYVRFDRFIDLTNLNKKIEHILKEKLL